MHTISQIEIVGDPERVSPRIYQLASDIQDWPTLLPRDGSRRGMKIRKPMVKTQSSYAERRQPTRLPAGIAAVLAPYASLRSSQMWTTPRCRTRRKRLDVSERTAAAAV